MPVDPQCQAILDMMASMNTPDFSEMNPEAARMVFASFPRPENPTPVAKVEQHTLTRADGVELPIRVYSPDTSQPRGALLYLHGGGWVMGDLDIYDEIARILASRSGLSIITVGYRLAPETPFPGALEDAQAALDWIVQQASELAIDPARLGVMGDSSGGNLAAALALKVRDEGGAKLAYQLLICPILDCRFDTQSYEKYSTGYFLTRASSKWFWDHYLPELDERTKPYASPLRSEDLSGLPSTLIVTAEYDPLRDEGAAYAHALEAAQVPTTHRHYESAVHGFIGFSAMVELSQQMLSEVSRHAAEQLAGS